MNHKEFFSQFKYVSRSEGIGGRIKVFPEDFIVEEVISKSVFKKQNCLIYRLIKRNWDTMVVIKEIAKRAGISYRDIGFAGTKDRHAITSQYISICGGNLRELREKIEGVEISDAKLEFVGYGKKLKLGSLWGNRFKIVVRELDVPVEEAMERTRAILKEVKAEGGFPNYFGYQRFGERRVINHEVGRLLLEGKFEEAALKFLGAYDGSMLGDEARKEFFEGRDVDRAIESFPKFLRYERAMLYRYRETKSWKKAFAVLPRPVLRIFIHAYQSYLFNKALSRRIEEGLPLNRALVGDIVCQVKYGIPLRTRTYKVGKNTLDFVNEKIRKGEAMVTAPLFGFASRLADGEMGRIEREILEEERLELEMFRMKPLKIMSEPGGRRELLIKPMGFKYRMIKEENAMAFRFFLPRGVYATSVLREIMKDY